MSAGEFDWKLEADVREGRRDEDPVRKRAHERITESDRRILAEYPVEQMGRNIRRRLEQSQRRQRWMRSGGVGVLAATACAVLLYLRAPQPPSGAEPEDIRLKGVARLPCATCGQTATHLHVFTGKEGQSLVAHDGMTARAGDRVQLAYHAGTGEGVIVSIDGRGGTTLHFPASPQATTELAPGDHLLPRGFELDDAPAFERFFFVTGAHVSVTQVLDAARKLASRRDAREAPLPELPGMAQESFTVVKPAGRPSP